METLKKIFGKNKKNEKSNANKDIIKYNQSEVEGFLVYSENGRILACCLKYSELSFSIW